MINPQDFKIGTTFKIANSSYHKQIFTVKDVSETQVMADANDETIYGFPFCALEFYGDERAATLRRVASATVGGWRRGQLTFSDAPLALVVADLQRYAGVHVAVSKSLRDRRFSGSLNIRDGGAAARDLAGLMGLALRADGNGYRLELIGR